MKINKIFIFNNALKSCTYNKIFVISIPWNKSFILSKGILFIECGKTKFLFAIE